MKKYRNWVAKSKMLIVLIALALLFQFVASVQIYSGDVNNHISWGRDFAMLGPRGIYQRDFILRYKTMSPTYPPIALTFFAFEYNMYDLLYNISWDLNLKYPIFPSDFIYLLKNENVLPAFLKIGSILADVGIALVLLQYAKKILKSRSFSAIWLFFLVALFNPAFIYNSAYWGQVDTIPLFFIILAFYFLIFSKRKFLPVVFYVIAILSKQSSIIFIPVFAVYYLHKYKLEQSIKGLLSAIGVFFLLFLPFFKSGNIILFPFKTYLHIISTGSGSDFITDHAFNFWSLTAGLGQVGDSLFLFFMPYRWWGYLIFLAIITIILINLHLRKYQNEFVFLSLTLIALSSFLFLTRMHSRYLIQAIPFLLILSMYNLNYFGAFAFVSIYNVINMYHNWWAPRITPLVTLFSKTQFINAITEGLILIYIAILINYLFTNRKGMQKSINLK